MSSYIFYKITCEDCPEYIYIGSTKSFRSRKYQHKSNTNKMNNKLYNKIRENGGWDNWSMNIIDEGNDLTLTEARIKEEELRIKYNGNLNSNKAHRTEEYKKENYENNKEKTREYYKEYYQNNKEKAREHYKEYNKNNKDKIKEKQKEYQKNNKEKAREYNKEYYQNNKEKAREYYKEYNKKKKEE